MEYAALSIPIVWAFVARLFFHRKVTWWELLIPTAVVFLVVLATKSIAEHTELKDTEYWGGWVTHVTYEEPWDEKVSCSHAKYRTEYYSCGTAERPQTCSREVFDGYEHSYDVDYHEASWTTTDSNDFTFSISQERFEKYCDRFGNREFVELNRDFHRIDGDSYVTKWKGDRATLTPTVTTHTFDNKVAKSKSIYSYPDVDPKKTPVYDYPQIRDYTDSSVLSKTKFKGAEEIDKVNAVLGAKKKVRIWLLIYEGNVPRQVGLDQEAYWKGSNKNELVICVNVKSKDDPTVNWAHVFSWSTSENLKTAIESYLVVDNPKMDLISFAQFLELEVETKWVKRNWHDFDYLSIETPAWVVWVSWILVMLITCGLAYFFMTNEYDSE